MSKPYPPEFRRGVVAAAWKHEAPPNHIAKGAAPARHLSGECDFADAEPRLSRLLRIGSPVAWAKMGGSVAVLPLVCCFTAGEHPVVNHVNFIWNIAESLRGPFKPSEYGSVVLPFTVLRRLDAVLADTKPAVLEVAKSIETLPEMLQTIKLTEASGRQFYNTSRFDFAKLVADPQDLRANLSVYLAGFSPRVRDIFERFEFDKTLNKLAEKNKLFAVTEKFAQADFHPRTVSNFQMGLVFEELIRWANERSNETAGDHYTPREVIALMVQLLFALDDDALSKSGVVRSIYDPAAGTGGMLSVADEYLRKMNPGIHLSL